MSLLRLFEEIPITIEFVTWTEEVIKRLSRKRRLNFRQIKAINWKGDELVVEYTNDDPPVLPDRQKIVKIKHLAVRLRDSTNNAMISFTRYF